MITNKNGPQELVPAGRSCLSQTTSWLNAVLSVRQSKGQQAADQYVLAREAEPAKAGVVRNGQIVGVETDALLRPADFNGVVGGGNFNAFACRIAAGVGDACVKI